MKIRNLNETHRIMPAQHREAAVGEEIDWPADVPVPDGFVITEGAPTSPKPPTKKELLEEATALGLTVDSKIKVDELRVLVAQAKLDQGHGKPEPVAEVALEA